MEDAAAERLGIGRQGIYNLAMGRAGVNQQWQVEANGPTDFSIEDGQLLFAPTGVPIQIYADFAHSCITARG